MAIYSSILTGGVNNHETTSEEANGIATDFVNEGIVGVVGNSSGVAPMTGGFAVNEQSSPDMAVDVSAGVAYVEGTPTSQNAQTFRIKNTATEEVVISANSSGSTKYDWLYISLSAANLNAPNVAGDDVATLVTSRSTSASADDGTPPTYGYAIAVITVANGASTITDANIRDVRSQLTLDTGVTVGTDGWNTLDSILSVATGYNKGNREYEIDSTEDLTSTLSPGMRLKLSRGTTPPTQCLDLESGSSQYASKSSPSGITFTDDFTCEAWIKLESYAQMFIVNRLTASQGWTFYVMSDGRLSIIGRNSTDEQATSYQSVPLNKWVHVAASLDLSGNSRALYIDGVSVPYEAVGSLSALVQPSTDLRVGAYSGGATSLFDGKIADVRVWSAVRTATQIRDNMNQQLVGNETNLVAYFKLDGDLNDSTSNANNLTGSGGAAATNSDNPMKSTEYGIVTKVASDKITVFTGTDYNIPNATLSSPSYSQHKIPFGFPAGKGKWRIESLLKIASATTSNANWGSFLSNGWALFVPIGSWKLGFSALLNSSSTTRVFWSISPTALSGASGTEDSNWTTAIRASAAASTDFPTNLDNAIELTADQTWVMYTLGSTTSANALGTHGLCVIRAECAYL